MHCDVRGIKKRRAKFVPPVRERRVVFGARRKAHPWRNDGNSPRKQILVEFRFGHPVDPDPFCRAPAPPACSCLAFKASARQAASATDACGLHRSAVQTPPRHTHFAWIPPSAVPLSPPARHTGPGKPVGRRAPVAGPKGRARETEGDGVLSEDSERRGG